MPIERSAGIIFFRPVRSQSQRKVGTDDAQAHMTSNGVRNTSQNRKYLVIRSSYHGEDGKYNFWDFPKGLLEKNEDGIAAAKREAEEEVGIEDFLIYPEFKATVRYFVRRDRDKKAVLKFVAMFLAEAKTDKIKLSWEHDAYEWLLYAQTKKRISRKEMKKALEVAEKFLKKHD